MNSAHQRTTKSTEPEEISTYKVDERMTFKNDKEAMSDKEIDYIFSCTFKTRIYLD